MKKLILIGLVLSMVLLSGCGNYVKDIQEEAAIRYQSNKNLRLNLTTACERGCMFAHDVEPNASIMDYPEETSGKVIVCIGECNGKYYWGEDER